MSRSSPAIAGTLAALLLLPGAYMGAYYGMLDRESFKFGVGVSEDAGIRALSPSYRIKSRTVRTLFWPANQIDRLIRQCKWGEV